MSNYELPLCKPHPMRAHGKQLEELKKVYYSNPSNGAKAMREKVEKLKTTYCNDGYKLRKCLNNLVMGIPSQYSYFAFTKDIKADVNNLLAMLNFEIACLEVSDIKY